VGADAPAGEVRLGISKGALEDELIELRRSVWLKIGVAGAIALSLLGLGLFYVLYLIRKNRDLERAQQSAARASYVGVLASRLAHEIRNPLNAMNMNLQMLEEELHAESETTDPEHFELLESTKSEVKRLASLVNNFLTYARPPQARLASRDLNALARELVRLLEADFRQHGVRLVVDLEPLLPHVETDETQLKQAVINLLVNARQILGQGGVVTLKTRAGSKGEVVIEVEDNGPGVPPEVRERIFEVFYSSRGGGTGLGLPIAKQIVERHGGQIELDSVEGQGTIFRIRLPRAQGRVEPAEGAESER
jgi:signal transduction histidine kinase